VANTWTNFYPTFWSDVASFEFGKAAIGPSVSNMTWSAPGNGEAIRIPRFAYGETSGTHLDLVTSLYDSPDEVSEATIQLLLDHSWGFHFQIRYEEQEKAGVNLGEAVLRQRSAALAAKVDTALFDVLTGATTTLTGAVNKATVVSAIEDLNQANAPQDGRILLVDPTGYSDLLNSSEFTEPLKASAGTAANITGYVGRVLGCDVFMSNCVPAGFQAFLYHRSTLALAVQRPMDVRVFDQPRHFAVGYSGRTRWGQKLIDADLAVAIV
jgi:hypothetical protein